ncbi:MULTISPECIES: flavin-containing monooxygenase [Tsukamurella]|uniref:flavin-containing monooxygenase n=1 Tax=Tsukamurella TaxID=2060 RepID=UPI002DD44ECA|nr:NAD(P)/FAD-dependent oxidoreductase [Tsukamurella tyrosinosolvens]MEC4614955.1 NAD(P)/FAD-dependent oxidoreductase [Tsukamurella tyrosinosolvens]
MTQSSAADSFAPQVPSTPDHHVVVIGAGLSGIAAAVRLQEAGINDFVVVDRADDLGGTWRDNTYPGVAVDIPSIAYQFTFHRNPNWSRVFAPGSEVQQYHQDVVDHFGLRNHLRFRTEVLAEKWDDENHLWRLPLADGDVLTARFVISAIGPFINPKPAGNGIPGFDDFLGTVAVPARWDPSYDLTGKRVAVIGTGATGVQLAGHVAPDVAAMTVFQRTPVYCVPKPDFRIPSALRLLLRVPGVAAALNTIGLIGAHLGLWLVINTPGFVVRPAMRLFDRVMRRAYRGYLGAILDDPATADALTPSFGMFGNRPTLNSSFPRAFNLPTVELCTTAIDRVVPQGIRTVDGTVHEFDYIVSATGHELFSEPSSFAQGRVVGVDGADLGRWWNENGMQAYESVALPLFPNRWMIVGPYSWTGTGWHGLAENAATHIVRAISLADARSATRMEVQPAALQRFTALMLRQGRHLKYYFTELNKGVHSYWVNSAGEIPILRATTILAARKASRAFPADDYSYR